MNAAIPAEGHAAPHAALQPELLQTLRAVLGQDGVVADAQGVESITRTCMPFRTMPSAVVYPRNVGQVQAAVKAVVQAGVPLWPVSTGRNWGYGEKSAVYE